MIDCNHYDYVEIVCLFHYPVRLTLDSGDTIEGVALDTQRNDSCQECIKIQVDKRECLVLLDSLIKLEVLVTNPHFQLVNFIEKSG